MSSVLTMLEATYLLTPVVVVVAHRHFILMIYTVELGYNVMKGT